MAASLPSAPAKKKFANGNLNALLGAPSTQAAAPGKAGPSVRSSAVTKPLVKPKGMVCLKAPATNSTVRKGSALSCLEEKAKAILKEKKEESDKPEWAIMDFDQLDKCSRKPPPEAAIVEEPGETDGAEPLEARGGPPDADCARGCGEPEAFDGPRGREGASWADASEEGAPPPPPSAQDKAWQARPLGRPPMTPPPDTPQAGRQVSGGDDRGQWAGQGGDRGGYSPAFKPRGPPTNRPMTEDFANSGWREKKLWKPQDDERRAAAGPRSRLWEGAHAPDAHGGLGGGPGGVSGSFDASGRSKASKGDRTPAPAPAPAEDVKAEPPKPAKVPKPPKVQRGALEALDPESSSDESDGHGIPAEYAVLDLNVPRTALVINVSHVLKRLNGCCSLNQLMKALKTFKDNTGVTLEAFLRANPDSFQLEGRIVHLVDRNGEKWRPPEPQGRDQEEDPPAKGRSKGNGKGKGKGNGKDRQGKGGGGGGGGHEKAEARAGGQPRGERGGARRSRAGEGAQEPRGLSGWSEGGWHAGGGDSWHSGGWKNDGWSGSSGWRESW